MLSDESLAVTTLYGLLHKNVLVHVRGPMRDVAVPATVLIGPDGIVKWAQVSPDVKERPEPEKLLEMIRESIEG